MLTTTDRATINRENASHSTGPVTEEGKARSSRNAFQHGLASGQLIIPGESQEDFDALAQDLLYEHEPATTTENMLVQQMAQFYWLMQRAIRLQQEAFAAAAPGELPPNLHLLLRYQTTHERAFHKAQAALLRLKMECGKAEARFVSQQSQSQADRLLAAIQAPAPAGLLRAHTPPPPPPATPKPTLQEFISRARTPPPVPEN